MQILTRRAVLAQGAALAGAASLPAAAALAEARVHTASPQGALVDSVVVLGARDAVLIDAQFLLADAQALAEAVAATGRRLTTVFITHAHPDHFLGLGAITEKFPEARVVAHPAIAAAIAEAGPGYLAANRARAAQAFAERLVPVAPLEGPLLLEGERLAVLGPMAGDTARITPVWLPQLATLVATDVVYQGTHAWLREAITQDARDAWRRSLDQLAALPARVVVPGHLAPGAPMDASGYAHTRKILDAWESALAQPTRQGVIEAMQARLGELPAKFFLDIAAAAARP